jgi:pantothenate kinase
VLQIGRPLKEAGAIPYVSDFFDFSIYLDADEDALLNWYVNRFLTLRSTAFRSGNGIQLVTALSGLNLRVCSSL